MISALKQNSFDIIFLADFTFGGDAGFRISQEIRACAEIGCRIGLIHLQVQSANATISPDVQICVREKLAEVIAPETAVHTKLSIVYPAANSKEPLQGLAEIKADKVVFVHDNKPNRSRIGHWLSYHFGPVTWAPTNRWVRSSLAALHSAIPLSEEDWRPTGRALAPMFADLRTNQPTVFGRVSNPGASQWPETIEDVLGTYPIGNGTDFRLMGAPASELKKELGTPAGLKIFEKRDVSVERLLEMLDVFMYFPGILNPRLPEAAIATAMASGKIVMLPPHLECHFGPGAIYCEPTEAKELITNLLADNNATLAAQKNAIHHAKFQFPETRYRDKILDLLETDKPGKAQKNLKKKTKRVLFLTSNGVGLGHVTRLLAIARRMDVSIEPVFATMAQAAPIIESFGYQVEYIPSQTDTGTDASQWDNWLRYELGELIDRYDPSAVVFDGNHPSPGIISAVLSRKRRGLVWVRRGMMGESTSPHIENSRFMDLIIEPGEIAAERDMGLTADRKHEALQVAPITLLDRDELLPREAALKELGLSNEKTTAIVQLGGNTYRDVVSLTGEVVNLLKRLPNLQIVLVEWENSTVEFPQWASTRIIRGFPISRYFNAFDFSIAAAGYNTYHEVMAFGLPTVFIANQHPSMDDQGARAEYAQDCGAAFDLPEDQLFHLPTICEVLMTAQARDVVREEADNLFVGNGAAMAAKAITDLVGKI